MIKAVLRGAAAGTYMALDYYSPDAKKILGS
jgi:hypothetical protein